ncbi:signal recognition particle-docking protein FtsY [Halobacterium bonnevillei]|uniref:Signal recognition particle receptor FtsY n=1 Tax=Halobacterium bonnevillei TaxID=2692200 RepID=A0A6B0SMU4_9EURY|nr:signal recognition particle-docking protein FtsY [Halobacterium bonnevillei]MXR21816.1 signal recognition particle-docking protein FtsY [Halobacterium bonnevillei]
MFDGLKDKLSNFREDAEEVAEENAEAIEDDEQAAAEAEAVADGEPVEAQAGAAAGDGADAAAGDVADAEAASADPDSADDEPDEESSGGFMSKASSLARGRVIIEEDDLEGPLRELEFALLESDVEMSVAEAILDQIREDLVGEEKKFTKSTGSLVESALRDALLSVIDVDGFDFEDAIANTEKPVTVVFTGVNGVGKTTTIAKLGKRLEDQGYSVVLANGDTYRAGANEQLQEHADNLDMKLISHEQGGDPTAVVYDAVEYAKANDIDVVLGDTAGRLHTSSDLMQQLEKLDRVVDPDYTIFVDEAVAGQDAVNRASEFDDAAAIDGTILTMADADSQGGAAISVSHVTGKPILFLGTGQGYDDIQPFDPDALVDDLLAD